MTTWIITGGAGSGKSALMQGLGFCMGGEAMSFSSDAWVHRLLDDREICERISRRFGSEFVTQSHDGSLKADRARIRERVFGSQEDRLWLEALLHPKVMEQLQRDMESARAGNSKVFLAEIPLYYEIQASLPVDLVIVVAASPAIQILRLTQARGLSEEQAKRILDAQLPVEDKMNKADVVVWNDGSYACLEEQALTLVRDHFRA